MHGIPAQRVGIRNPEVTERQVFRFPGFGSIACRLRCSSVRGLPGRSAGCLTVTLEYLRSIKQAIARIGAFPLRPEIENRDGIRTKLFDRINRIDGIREKGMGQGRKRSETSYMSLALLDPPDSTRRSSTQSPRRWTIPEPSEVRVPLLCCRFTETRHPYFDVLQLLPGRDSVRRWLRSQVAATTSYRSFINHPVHPVDPVNFSSCPVFTPYVPRNAGVILISRLTASRASWPPTRFAGAPVHRIQWISARQGGFGKRRELETRQTGADLLNRSKEKPGCGQVERPVRGSLRQHFW